MSLVVVCKFERVAVQADRSSGVRTLFKLVLGFGEALSSRGQELVGRFAAPIWCTSSLHVGSIAIVPQAVIYEGDIGALDTLKRGSTDTRTFLFLAYIVAAACDRNSNALDVDLLRGRCFL